MQDPVDSGSVVRYYDKSLSRGIWDNNLLLGAVDGRRFAHNPVDWGCVVRSGFVPGGLGAADERELSLRGFRAESEPLN